MSPRDQDESALRRETSSCTIHIICTRYSFAFDNIITKAQAPCNYKPVTADSEGLSRGNTAGMRQDLNKGVLREELSRVFRRNWQDCREVGEHRVKFCHLSRTYKNETMIWVLSSHWGRPLKWPNKKVKVWHIYRESLLISVDRKGWREEVRSGWWGLLGRIYYSLYW